MEPYGVTIDSAKSPPALEFSPQFNVAVPFIDRHVAQGRGAKVAIRTTSGREVTYGDLARSVNRCGNHLLGLGIEPGERILLILKDCPEFFFLFWGAIKAGIVPVPLNTLLRARDYRYFLEDSGAAGVFYSAEFRGEVEPALASVNPAPRHAVEAGAGESRFDSKLAEQDDRLEALLATPDADCFWLYSSGSTGVPKGAVHSHRAMVVTSERYGVETLGVTGGDVCFSAAKLFFAYGLGNSMTFPLWAGAASVLLDVKPTPDLVFRTIEQFRPTLFFGVPTLFAAQLRALESQRYDVTSLRACVSAGEALPADILRRFKEKTGVDILDGIGSTEALHIFISNRAGDIKPGSSGRLVPGYDASIVDGQGETVAPGTSGRLMVAGASTAKYYWNKPDKTASTMRDGWLDTGDTYILDEHGYYIYCGRTDDMLKVGGNWCSPFEIEACLIEHPKVLEAAVVGRADADGLIKPEAFVVLKDGRGEDTAALAAELLRHCRQGLAGYKYPRWINFVAELPKTATGKIQRYKLRSLWAEAE